MSLADWIGTGLITLSLPFFLAAGVGLLRFPDVYTRLHALTKADNIGLGLVIAGVSVITADPWIALKLAAIWLLLVLGSATVAHVVANTAWTRGDEPRRSE